MSDSDLSGDGELEPTVVSGEIPRANGPVWHRLAWYVWVGTATLVMGWLGRWWGVLGVVVVLAWAAINESLVRSLTNLCRLLQDRTMQVPCEGCNGTGQGWNYYATSGWFTQECSHCGGSGDDKDVAP